MAVKIQLESKNLHTALGIAARVAVAQDGSVTFAGSKNTLTLHSVGDLSRCALVIPADVSGEDFEFAIPLDAIRDATKGRDTVEMSWDGNMLTIKSKGYKTDLLTLDAISRDDVDKVEAQEWKLTPEQGTWLKGALTAVGLKPTALLSTFIPVSVKLTSKAAFVGCYDNQHMAFLNSRELTGDLELTLPLDTFATILEVFQGQAFRMRVSQSRVELKSKTASIILSLPAMDGAITIDAVIAKAKEAASASGIAVTLSKPEVLTFLDNARSVVGKERAELVVEAKDKKAKFTIQTVRGTANAMLATDNSKAVSCKIDVDYFDELVRKIKGDTLEISVVGNAFISSKSGNTHFLVALNQEPSKK